MEIDPHKLLTLVKLAYNEGRSHQMDDDFPTGMNFSKKINDSKAYKMVKNIIEKENT